MGTNYYLHTGICSCCGRYDRHHICKSFRTWHALTEWQDEDPWDEVVTVGTWPAWKTLIRAEGESGARIFDEYGTEISLHEFIELGDKSPTCDSDELLGHGGWISADGRLFYKGEFS